MAILGGIVGKLLGLALLIVVLLVATGVFLYATDYAVEATVIEKDCQSTKPAVTVKTRMGGLTETVDVTPTECAVIQRGNFVEFHVRSQRTVIYEHAGGPCVYDTANRVC